MTAQLGRERREIIKQTANHIISREDTSEHSENLKAVAGLALLALAGMDSEPSFGDHMTLIDKGRLMMLERSHQTLLDYRADSVWYWQGDEDDQPESLSCPVIMSAETLRELLAKAAPPAPVAVPDEQHSERFEWSFEDWANHLGGRHQNNDPACYYEFGSFMAVAEMLRQFGNVQRKIGWNVCRAAMLKAGPVTGWIKCSERMPAENDRDIWLWNGSGHPQNGYIWNGDRFVDWNEEYMELDDVTHWMPMSFPAAPEQEV